MICILVWFGQLKENTYINFFKVIRWEIESTASSGGQWSYIKYEGWNFNSGNYLFTTDTK